MYLGAVRVCQWLYILVSVGLVLWDAVLERGIDCSVEPFHLAIDLGVIGGRCPLPDSKARGHGQKERWDLI